MRFPCGAHPLASPMVPAGPHRLGRVVGRVAPLGLPGSASWRRLSSSSPPHGCLTQATLGGPCCGYHSGPRGRGVRKGIRLHFWSATPPPPPGWKWGHRHTGSALSMLGTTKGRRLDGRSRGPSPSPDPSPTCTAPMPVDRAPVRGWAHTPRHNPPTYTPEGDGCPGRSPCWL